MSARKSVTKWGVLSGVAVLAVLGLSACNGGGSGSDPQVLGMDTQNGSPASLPWADTAPANDLVLAVKFVTYTENGGPIDDAPTAQAVMNTVNQIYTPCNIHFRVEEFDPVNPADYGLALHPSTMAELDQIRAKFDEPNRLVIVITGSWDHSGGLGADGANAWTAMPGETPSGAIFEAPVATMGPIFAHELGHYLNLDHVSDQTDMMNPVVYGNSTGIAPWQCTNMRQAAQTVRTASLR